MRYYIYVYWKQIKTAQHQVTVLDNQPMEGFETEAEAEEYLLKRIEAREEYYFKKDWYKFTILKTWQAKNAKT